MFPACARLDGEGLLHLEGRDIAGFLQGQLTCDLRTLAADRAVCGALCNPQGRVLADLRVIAVDEGHCILRLRDGVAEATAARLATYARFSRIGVRVDEGDTTVIAGQTTALRPLLERLALPVPQGTGAVTHADSNLAIGLGADRVELLLCGAGTQDALSALGMDCTNARETAWQAAELATGDYRIECEDIGEYTPQALNYDHRGLVSFSKGCYTGQEVVARLHYKGRSKRRLAIRCLNRQSAAPRPGSAIVGEGGTVVGTLMRSCQLDAHHCVLALMITADLPDSTPLSLEDGTVLTALQSGTESGAVG